MIRELLERRIPQFVGLYLVGCWGFLEFFDWLVTRYVLSPTLVDFAIAALLLFLPTVVIIAWRHGAPGPDEWKRVDLAALGLNALVAAGVLFAMFRGEDLGAATTVKLIEDAEGNTVEREVPREGFRRSVMLFDFENETENPELDWLSYGIGDAVAVDLAQDLFVTTVRPDDQSVEEWLAERGVEPGGDVPLSLQRDAARLRGTEHFFGGSIHEAPGDSVVLVTRLYLSATGREVASHEYRAAGPLEVADRVTLDLRKDLGVPEGRLEQSLDLPVSELLTESPAAYRVLAEGRRALVIENDPQRAEALAERAIALDSTAAMAHLLLASVELFTGRQAEAAASLADASRYAYRLPEPVRLSLQVQEAYLIHGDVEAAVRAGRYWTEVYPEDVDGRRLLAAIHGSAGNIEERIRHLRALVAIDSMSTGVLRDLAGAFRAQAQYDSAIAYYERLRDRVPDDLATRLELASTLMSIGRFDSAREELEEAAVVAPRDPDVPRELADLAIRQGDFEAAAERLEQVKALERTPLERLSRTALEETLYYHLGQFDRLEDAYRRRLALEAEVGPPIQVVQSVTSSEYLTRAHEAGREAEALAQLDSLASTVEEPWSLVTAYPAVRNHLPTGNIDAAREDLEAIRRFVQFAGPADVRESFIAWIEAEIALREDGDCGRAMALYDRSRTLNPESALAHVGRLACLAERERWDEGEADVEWLLDRHPARPIYLLEIARFEAARGRTAEALAHLDRALDTWSAADPDYRPAREARALRERLRAAPRATGR